MFFFYFPSLFGSEIDARSEFADRLRIEIIDNRLLNCFKVTEVRRDDELIIDDVARSGTRGNIAFRRGFSS